ncbi:hypothetical protein [Zobellella aerophila]|uniref:Uncharacterized protein n=1 Tax=Zobellella aerophila TaxID=870480 RepID=A0ABP6VI11_9GAMM
MNNVVFKGTLEICDLHAERLSWAMNTLSVPRPFTPEKLNQLTAIDMAVVDQFIVRFSKLPWAPNYYPAYWS